MVLLCILVVAVNRSTGADPYPSILHPLVSPSGKYVAYYLDHKDPDTNLHNYSLRLNNCDYTSVCYTELEFIEGEEHYIFWSYEGDVFWVCRGDTDIYYFVNHNGYWIKKQYDNNSEPIDLEELKKVRTKLKSD